MKQNLREVVADRMLVVPDYQRPYAWEERQLKDLWDDLNLAGPRKKHFAGTLILRTRADDVIIDRWGQEATRVDVVDGQQRLTTCLLLLDRVRRRLVALEPQVPEAGEVGRDLNRWFGILEDEHGVKHPRLQPGQEVKEFWWSLLTDEAFVGTPLATHKRLQRATKYFDERLDETLRDCHTEVTFQRLKDLRTRIAANLQFLVYEVESIAEVGVIFETVNDRGHPLSELEKTKNYFLYLARQIEPEQRGDQLADQVNSDWAKIFENLANSGSDAEDQLLRAHWLATCNPDPRTWQGAASIKRRFARSKYIPSASRLDADGADERAPEGLWNELYFGIEKFSRELKEASAYLRDSLDPHARFDAFWPESERVRGLSAALLRSGISATYRPLFVVARLKHPNDGARYAELVRLADAYSTRVLLILQYRSNAGQNRLFSLAHKLYQGESFDTVLDSIRRLLLDWAPDQAVRTALLDTGKDWYNRRGHKYLLYEYELHLARSGALVPAFDTFTVGKKVPARTTEHIYPQTPDPSWARAFPTREDQALRHSLGNLVLTLDNSSYSNKPFLEKRGDYGTLGEAPRVCYAQSTLKQERELAQYDEWTPDKIRERQRVLADFAMQRWHVAPPDDALAETDELEDEPAFDDVTDAILDEEVAPDDE